MFPGPNRSQSNVVTNTRENPIVLQNSQVHMTNAGPFATQSSSSHSISGNYSQISNNYATMTNSWPMAPMNALQQPDGSRTLESRQSYVLQQIHALQQRALELRAEDHALSASMPPQSSHRGRDSVHATPTAYAEQSPSVPPTMAALYQQGNPALSPLHTARR